MLNINSSVNLFPDNRNVTGSVTGIFVFTELIKVLRRYTNIFKFVDVPGILNAEKDLILHLKDQYMRGMLPQ